MSLSVPSTKSGSSLPGLFRKSLPFIAPHTKSIGLITAMVLLLSGLAAVEPLALKMVFDALAQGGAERTVLSGIGAVLGIVVVREAVGALMDRQSWGVRIGVNYSLTRAMVERLHALPLSFHRKESVGAIMTKMDRGIQGFCGAFGEIAFKALPSVVYLIVAAVIMVHLDWRLALIVLLCSPIPALIGARAAKEQAERERSLMAKWTKLFSRFNEVLSSIAVVKSYVREDCEKRQFLAGVKEANGVVLNGVAVDARTTAKKNGAAGFARVAALGVGALLVMNGSMTLGTLVAFVGYVGALFGPVQGLTGAYQTLRKGSVALETVFSVLDEPDVLGDAPNAKPAGTLAGRVELRDVEFSYRAGRPVLKNVSLVVPAGETIALVGPSGSGKSTLTKLITRLYDPCSGKVLVDDMDVRELTQKSLRLQIGVVLQEAVLFSDSVRENIAFGKPGAKQEEIEAAAKAANAHDFIMQLPNGYDTLVGERGANLSGGQAQRIQIARALLKNPPILILDEATSALDAESEALVQQALETLKKGRTTFIIAHRLSTVARADRIAVLAAGRVVEIGTHDELLRARGAYWKLVTTQRRGSVSLAA